MRESAPIVLDRTPRPRWRVDVTFSLPELLQVEGDAAEQHPATRAALNVGLGLRAALGRGVLSLSLADYPQVTATWRTFTRQEAIQLRKAAQAHLEARRVRGLTTEVRPLDLGRPS